MKATSAATVRGLGIADTAGDFVTRALEEVQLTLGGIEGDRHFGLTAKAGVREKRHPRGVEIRNARQLSILSVEELAEVAATLKAPELSWQRMGGSVLLEGRAQLTQLSPSSRLVFPSGATVVIDSENEPCRKTARALAQPHFVKAAMHRRGLVGWVERAGVVRVGDVAKIWEP
ncbi:MAG: MOSC domain-containing protein [Archangiaceae bacterium]|nr:MOSC domain-containing protein [Archangiaceae bacterium]